MATRMPSAFMPRGKSGRGGLIAAAAVAAGYLYLTHGGGIPSGPVTTAAVTSNVALGQQMAAAYGWTGDEWTCLNETFTRESSWSDTAANPSSDARGIAQKISGWSAEYPYGDARRQIAWGLAYIKSRYGSPCGAWVHEQQDGWY